MNKKNILENLELKLAKTKEENKEKFEKIESKVKEKKIITTREADTKKEKKLNKNNK